MSATAAYPLLWLAVAFDVLASCEGFGIDRRWHATAVTGALDVRLRAHTP